MNAWLITWEGTDRHITPENKLVVILSSRKSEKFIADLVEFVYLRAFSTASDMTYVANRPKERRKAKYDQGRVSCGELCCILFARKVTELTCKIDEETMTETLAWLEPPYYTFKNKQLYTKYEAEHFSFTRPLQQSVSRELFHL